MSLAHGHAASKHGADMWVNALNLYDLRVIQVWDWRGDCMLVTFLKPVRKATKSTKAGIKKLARNS